MIAPGLLVSVTPKVDNNIFSVRGNSGGPPEHRTRGLCQILHDGVVLSGPHVWIMGSLLKHTFRDVSHCLPTVFSIWRGVNGLVASFPFSTDSGVL
jgi:hypothetical protein